MSTETLIEPKTIRNKSVYLKLTKDEHSKAQSFAKQGKQSLSQWLLNTIIERIEAPREIQDQTPGTPGTPGSKLQDVLPKPLPIPVPVQAIQAKVMESVNPPPIQTLSSSIPTDNQKHNCQAFGCKRTDTVLAQVHKMKAWLCPIHKDMK